MYRVMYSEDLWDLWAKLLQALRDGEDNRCHQTVLGIQNDAAVFAKAGLLKTSEPLRVIETFEDEEDYTVWANLTESITEVSIIVNYV